MPRPDIPHLADGQAVLAQVAATGRRWLFIYDNVESLADIKELIPQGAHLIVTTRGAGGWPGFEVQRPGVLGFDTEGAPAVRLLQGEAGRLAEVLAHVPANEDYPTSVLGAVRLSYDALTDDARAIADLCAWRASEGLGPDLLTQAPGSAWWALRRDEVPVAVQALAADGARVRAGFRDLTARSLLGGEGGVWAMHRMTALLVAVYPEGARGGGYSENWPLCARLTPHVRAIWASGAAPNTAAMEHLLNASGICLNAIADYPGAVELSAAMLTRTEARLPESDREVALALANHGDSLRRTGDLVGARELLERAVALNAAHRPGSADLADCHDLLGGVLLDQGRLGQDGAIVLALRQYQQALLLHRRLSGRAEPVARALNNLGAVRDAQGRRAAAARLYGASVRIVRAVLPPGDVQLGYGLLNTGAAWLEAGRADLAEPRLQEALDLWQLVYAGQPQHPATRAAAGWLISCLLRRAAAADNRGRREMEARQLSDRYGFDFAERRAEAMRYPYDPDPGGQGEGGPRSN